MDLCLYVSAHDLSQSSRVSEKFLVHVGCNVSRSDGVDYTKEIIRFRAISMCRRAGFDWLAGERLQGKNTYLERFLWPIRWRELSSTDRRHLWQQHLLNSDHIFHQPPAHSTAPHIPFSEAQSAPLTSRYSQPSLKRQQTTEINDFSLLLWNHVFSCGLS